jgi:hypothetical protein
LAGGDGDRRSPELSTQLAQLEPNGTRSSSATVPPAHLPRLIGGQPTGCRLFFGAVHLPRNWKASRRPAASASETQRGEYRASLVRVERVDTDDIGWGQRQVAANKMKNAP